MISIPESSDVPDPSQDPDRGGRTIDIHAHRECASVRERMREEEKRAGRVSLAVGNELTKEVNVEQLQTVRAEMDDVTVRLRAMDEQGIDMQVVSITPYQFYYWLDGSHGAEIAAEINEDLASTVRDEPRLAGLGTLPLQDAGRAVAEMENCLKLELAGVTIGTNVNGEDLSSPRLWELFEAAEALQVGIFMHSNGYTCQDRLEDHYFMNVLGHPFEGSVAVAHLIFDGALERFPELRLVVAHGGGYLAAYPGRLDHAYQARRDVGPDLPHAPSTYLDRIHFDTMVFEHAQLEFLAQMYGAEKLLLGTDYPYDMGDRNAISMIDSSRLSTEDKQGIKGANAERVFGELLKSGGA